MIFDRDRNVYIFEICAASVLNPTSFVPYQSDYPLHQGIGMIRLKLIHHNIVNITNIGACVFA